MTTEALATPNLTYTLPPPALVMPQGGQEILLWLFGGSAVLFALYATWLSYRRGSWLPLLFVIAGGFSIMLEPMADAWGNVIHPPVGQINAFVAEGHPVPWHVVAGYVWYYGWLNVFFFDRFRARTMTPSLWWKTAFWTAIWVTAFEQIPIYYGLWVYYADHAFRVGLMPLAMASANAASVMVPSLLVYRLMPILTGWKQLLVLALVPCTVVGTHAGASIPSYLVLGQDTAHIPFWILQAGTLTTAVFSLMLIWLCINIIHHRFPEAERYVEPASPDSTPHGQAKRTAHV